MTRENILFALVGLLAGYVAAFHLVVYVNQNLPEPSAARPAAGAPAELPTNDVKERQRLQSAAETAALAARENAQNFEAQTKAAQAYLEAGDYEEAVDFLTRANQLRPDDYETLVKLGNANYSARRFEVAERWYLAALAKRPDDVNVRSELAGTYYLREPSQPDRAMAVLRETLERDPRHVASLHNLAFLLIESRKFDEAAETLDRLERVEPSYPQLPGLREELRKARAGAEDDPGKSSTD